MAKIETDYEARQGPSGKPVLYVLIGALLLAAAYLVGTLVWSGATAPPNQINEPGQATSPSQTAPATPPAAQQAPKPQ